MLLYQSVHTLVDVVWIGISEMEIGYFATGLENKLVLSQMNTVYPEASVLSLIYSIIYLNKRNCVYHLLMLLNLRS